MKSVAAMLLLLMVGSLAMSAATLGDSIMCDGLCYRVVDSAAVELVAKSGEPYSMERVVIPAYVHNEDTNRDVVAIGNDAFADCEQLTSITLPITLREIGDRAFAGCTHLEGSIVLPECLQHVGHNAFAECATISRLSLPATLEAIGDDAFAGCTGLDTIFSHVPSPAMVVPWAPEQAVLCVNPETFMAYSQAFNGKVKALVDVDSDPGNALPCDVNGDGVVSGTDVTTLYNYLLGDTDICYADPNSDGIVNGADVTTLYNCFLNGDANAAGASGYNFVLTGNLSRVTDRLFLSKGTSVSIVAHDNEKNETVPHGIGVMAGGVPVNAATAINDNTQAVRLSNERYTTGTTTQITLYCDLPGDTIYYKDVQVDVQRHVVTDTLRVLSIGNSFALDAFSYMPFVMDAVAPQVYLKLGITYIGYGALDDYVHATENDTTLCRYYWSYGAQPWTCTNKTMQEALDEQDWDVIVLQQNSNLSRDYGTYQPYLNQLIEWLDGHATYDHEYAWLITPSYPEGLFRLPPDTSSVQMFERIIESVRCVQRDMGIKMLLPCGTAIQNARTTPLDSLGNHLFSHLHLQDGIPCLIETYTAAAALLARYGLGDNMWTDATWIDAAWLRKKNVYETNEPLGTSEENRALAKRCAQEALANPLQITTITP